MKNKLKLILKLCNCHYYQERMSSYTFFFGGKNPCSCSCNIHSLLFQHLLFYFHLCNMEMFLFVLFIHLDCFLVTICCCHGNTPAYPPVLEEQLPVSLVQ